MFEDLATQPSAADPIHAHPYRRLFVASFSILFLELVLIRWVPSYVRMFGYFTNFILMGSLLGAGIGILTHRGARIRLMSFPVLLLLVVLFVLFNQYTFDVPTTDVLFYGAGQAAASRENYWVIPLIFTFLVLVFVPLGRELGRLLEALPPLKAYGTDIAGSLAGIACFALLAYLSLPPVVWFAVLIVVAWPLVAGRQKLIAGAMLSGVLVLVFIAGIH